MDGYEEEPAARRGRSTEADTGFGFESAPAASTSAHSGKTGFSGQVLSMNSGKQEVVLFRPTTFSDSTKAADDLRDKKAIIVNLENVDKTLSRRVVDFLSGCAYALDGKMTKVAASTYLFSPHIMDVVGDFENIQNDVESYV